MIFWKDKNGRCYWKSEIDDSYLLNIAKALTRGVGDIHFLKNYDLDSIFEECFNRGLLTAEEAHAMAEQAIDAICEKEESYWRRLSAEVDYEEHRFGSDD